MNSQVLEAYEAKYKEITSFREAIKFNDITLLKGYTFVDFTEEGSYKQLCEVVRDTMISVGVELIIGSTRIIENDDYYTHYVQMKCSFAKHAQESDEATKHTDESKECDTADIGTSNVQITSGGEDANADASSTATAKKQRKKKKKNKNAAGKEDNQKSDVQKDLNSASDKNERSEEETKNNTGEDSGTNDVGKQKKKKRRKRRTKRTSDCKCSLALIWKSNERVWRVNTVKCDHKGHVRVVHRTEELTDEEKQEICKMRNDLMGVQAIINYFRRVYGKRLSAVQIHNASQQIVDDYGELIKDASKSGQLLQYFNSLKEVVYIARFNVRKKDESGTVIGQLCQIKVPGHDCAYDRPDRFSDLCIQELLSMSPEEMQKRIPQIDSKKDSNDVYELYAISWVHVDVLKIASRYPEVLMTDATCKTNSSNRPLIFVCGIDSTGKTICMFSTLTTNESLDSFNFIIYNLLLLYGREWCSRVQVFISDGANEIISAIDGAINRDVFNRNHTKRFMCHHHAVNTKGMKDITHLRNELEYKLRSLLFLLIYRGFRELESKEESKIYFRYVVSFFQRMKEEGKLAQESHVLFERFLDAVLVNEAYLSNVHCQHLMHLGCRTSGRIEAENWSTKNTGVNPSTSILKLGVIDVARNVNRVYDSNLRYQREALVHNIHCTGYENICLQITDYAWELLHQQILMQSQYIVEMIDTNPLTFAVYSKDNVLKRDNVIMTNFTYEDGQGGIQIDLPKFNRVRILEVVDGYIVCSCPYFVRYGIPCRHMIAVNKGKISIADIHCRWTAAYAQGDLDDTLKRIGEGSYKLSPGATASIKASDYELSVCSENAPDDNAVDDDSQLNNDDIEDNATDYMDQEYEQESSEDEWCTEIESSERYKIIQVAISDVMELGKQFMLDSEATSFFMDRIARLISECTQYMKQEQNVSYKNAPSGAILDPLIIKNKARKSTRSKRADEIRGISGNKRRRSTFQETSLIEHEDVQHEPKINPKGRPKKTQRIQ
jgi:hypothetical protein